MKKLYTNFFLRESVLSPSPISRQKESLKFLLQHGGCNKTSSPDLVHVAHCDGGIEDVIEAVGGGLEARGGEAAHVLGDVVAEEIYRETDADQDDAAPQRPPLSPPNVLISVKTGFPAKGVPQTHINSSLLEWMFGHYFSFNLTVLECICLKQTAAQPNELKLPKLRDF